MTTSITKRSVLNDLRDKETRDLYVEEHIASGLPFQIHGLREKLGLTQSELAKRVGMAQERISKLEDPNYEFIPKINTLLKLANVFDVPLIVKFGTWPELFSWETNLTPELLAPNNFDEEVESLEAASLTTHAVTTTAYALEGRLPQFSWHEHAHIPLGWTVTRGDFALGENRITLSSLDNPLDLEDIKELANSHMLIASPTDVTPQAAGELDAPLSATEFFKKTDDVPTIAPLRKAA